MIELENKYVLHIPLYRFTNGKLVMIEIDDLLDDLIDMLKAESLYMTKVKSVYKKRVYDEILITIFSDDCSPVEEFGKWFRKNSDVLAQDAFAYEIGDRLIVEKLIP